MVTSKLLLQIEGIHTYATVPETEIDIGRQGLSPQLPSLLKYIFK
jgi:hypothetical protein